MRCQFEKESQGVEMHDTVEQIIKGTYVMKEEENCKSEDKGEEGKKEETEKEEGKKESAVEKKEEGEKKG